MSLRFDRDDLAMHALSLPPMLYEQFIVESQIKLHGFDVREALVEVRPRDGELLLRHDDIEAAIAEHGTSVALVLFSGVQYFTGQSFDVRSMVWSPRPSGFERLR
jgi:kynureninase